MSREKFNHGQRLKTARENHLRLSQQRLADTLGVPVHRIKDIETGKTRISVELALLLEDKFHLNLRWLLAGEAPMIGAEGIATQSGASHVNAKTLEELMKAVEDGLTRDGIVLDSSKKARLICILYEYATETGKQVEAELVDKYLELIA